MSEYLQIWQLVVTAITTIAIAYFGYLTVKVKTKVDAVEKVGKETHASVNSGALFQLRLYMTSLRVNLQYNPNDEVTQALVKACEEKITFLEKHAAEAKDIELKKA